jgi:hypothetical protein
MIQVNVGRREHTYPDERFRLIAYLERMFMRRHGPLQQRVRGHRASAALRRWLALLTALAIAAGAVFPVDDAAHANVAAAHSHESFVLMPDAGAQSGDASLAGDLHGAGCTLAGSCMPGIATAGPAVFIQPGMSPAARDPDAARRGNIPSPRFRPPKLSSNV